jgi:hypothetical protein
VLKIDSGVLVTALLAILALAGTVYGARRAGRSTDHGADLLAFREEQKQLFDHMGTEIERLREDVTTTRADVTTLRGELRAAENYIDRLEDYGDVLAQEIRRLGGTVPPRPPRTAP